MHTRRRGHGQHLQPVPRHFPQTMSRGGGKRERGSTAATYRAKEGGLRERGKGGGGG